MNENIPKWILESERDLPENKGSQWGYIKHKVGDFTRTYCANKKKKESLLKCNIERELNKLKSNLDNDSKAQYLKLKSQLEEITDNQVKGIILRSLCDEYERGESAPNTFLIWKKLEPSKKP